ncbi:sensor histidine kinase [uncultured Desulfosarcina sp.]|uniref:sensor histidine kinase n=1 Tax=uncultured Desulfosarcina sp. TaxID=218289 RepID=UPI0029C7F7C1|nr:sensor histidine kinase [uncultured Desulfosarcina sp.]
MTGIASKECDPGVSAAVELSVEAALFDWRRNAVEVFMASSVLVYLPGIILLVCGHGPPLTWMVRLLVYISYLAVVLSVFLKILDHRIRLYTMLSAAYLTAIAGAVAYPGPFIRALPVALPIIGLVLSGVRCGRITTTISVLVILFTPWLARIPVLTRTLRSSASPPVEPAVLMLVQGIGLTAMLLALMVLLESFYSFLVKALMDQHRSATDIKRKVIELTVAHDTLSREIDKRQWLEREVTRIADEEKRRLGLEIHDGVCQRITGALLRSEALARRIERGEPTTADEIGALSSLLEEAIDEAHGVARGLCPLDTSPNAVEAALRTLARSTQRLSEVACRFIVDGDIRISDPVTAQHLYRIAQEAVSNAVRHARASRIDVELCGNEKEIRLQVTDDGDGLPTALPSAGMGLNTMACRANLLAGAFSVTPAPGGGTCVCCTVPRIMISPPVEKTDSTGDECHG